MYYRVNVSLRGRHVFATAPESIHDQETLVAVVAKLRSAFTPAEGYAVSATHVTTTSHNVEV